MATIITIEITTEDDTIVTQQITNNKNIQTDATIIQDTAAYLNEYYRVFNINNVIKLRTLRAIDPWGVEICRMESAL